MTLNERLQQLEEQGIISYGGTDEITTVLAEIAAAAIQDAAHSGWTVNIGTCDRRCDAVLPGLDRTMIVQFCEAFERQGVPVRGVENMRITLDRP